MKKLLLCFSLMLSPVTCKGNIPACVSPSDMALVAIGGLSFIAFIGGCFVSKLDTCNYPRTIHNDAEDAELQEHNRKYKRYYSPIRFLTYGGLAVMIISSVGFFSFSQCFKGKV